MSASRISTRARARHVTDITNRIRDIAIGLGADPEHSPHIVHFSQSGRMRRDGSSRWMDFSAQHSIRTNECWFDWRAKTGPLGLVGVRDALIDGQGCLDVKAFGVIPMAHAKPTRELARGELMRYLAELPWNPDALLQNAALRWREITSDNLLVSARMEGMDAAVALHLDEYGRVVKTFAPDRPREINGKFVPTPWLGRFFDYEYRGRRLIPTRAQVSWIIEGVETLCWEGRIDAWRIA